jgi:hypothetical protein
MSGIESGGLTGQISGPANAPTPAGEHDGLDARISDLVQAPMSDDPTGVRPAKMGRVRCRFSMSEPLARQYVQLERAWDRAGQPAGDFVRFVCLCFWRAWGQHLDREPLEHQPLDHTPPSYAPREHDRRNGQPRSHEPPGRNHRKRDGREQYDRNGQPLGHDHRNGQPLGHDHRKRDDREPNGEPRNHEPLGHDRERNDQPRNHDPLEPPSLDHAPLRPAPPAYAPIYRRERYECASPTCERRDVTPHHLRFRSHGGGHEPSNVVALCSWCHLQGIHTLGAIRAEPPATRMRWKTPVLEVEGRVVRWRQQA